MVPNYGGIIELENSNSGNIVELHFYMSFISNVYSIQIVYKKNDMLIKIREGYLDDYVGVGLEKLVVSPTKDHYYNEFFIVEDLLKKEFENSIFLSYAIEKLKINNLEVTYMDKCNCTVGEAFFHKGMPLNYYIGEIPFIIGDENYKINVLK